MDYTGYSATLEALLVLQDPYGSANFTVVLPQAIEYAENRMYRDPAFDFLATRTTDAGQLTNTGQRDVPIPPQFVVIEGAALILPAYATTLTAGATRVPMYRTSQQYLDAVWPQESLTRTPAPFETFFCVYSNQQDPSVGPSFIPNTIRIAPTPDGTYHVEYTGTFQPVALSAANPITMLTRYYPDIFLAASMVWLTGWQRDYGAQSDDPKLAMSWERLYQQLRGDAGVIELRKKAIVGGYQTLPPNPSAPRLAAAAAGAG